jgi:hypothetical protein
MYCGYLISVFYLQKLHASPSRAEYSRNQVHVSPQVSQPPAFLCFSVKTLFLARRSKQNSITQYSVAAAITAKDTQEMTMNFWPVEADTPISFPRSVMVLTASFAATVVMMLPIRRAKAARNAMTKFDSVMVRLRARTKAAMQAMMARPQNPMPMT